MSIKTWSVCLVFAFAALFEAGCTWNRHDSKSASSDLLDRIGGGVGGQAVEPKRCLVKVWMISKPLRDRAVNDAAWERADEQLLESQTRMQFEDNGLRLGVVSGGLPPEIESILRADHPHKIEPAMFDLPDGNNTSIAVAASAPSVSIFLKRDGQGIGKDYKDASGFFRTTASQSGPTGVSLRIVPEIHHGPVLRRFDALPNNGGNYNPIQFMQKDGQQEETLRDMAATLNVEPGQFVLIGHNPDRKGSLGAFLLTRPEENSDRMLQKLIIIEVARSNPDAPGSHPKRPSDLQPVEPPDLPMPKPSTAKPAE